jgi:hypothetical protein
VDDEYLKNKVQLFITGSYFDGYPFPKLIDVGLSVMTLDKDFKPQFRNIEAKNDNEENKEDESSHMLT